MNIIFNGTSRVSTDYSPQCQKMSVSTKCPDTLLSDCNHYCYYFICYYYYLCKYIYIYIKKNINKSPAHPDNRSHSVLHLYWDHLFSHEHQLFFQIAQDLKLSGRIYLSSTLYY